MRWEHSGLEWKDVFRQNMGMRIIWIKKRYIIGKITRRFATKNVKKSTIILQYLIFQNALKIGDLLGCRTADVVYVQNSEKKKLY